MGFKTRPRKSPQNPKPSRVYCTSTYIIVPLCTTTCKVSLDFVTRIRIPAFDRPLSCVSVCFSLSLALRGYYCAPVGPSRVTRLGRDSQGWVIDAMEILVVAFVLEDIATTFELGSVGKGLIGSASFFGEREGRRWGGGRLCPLAAPCPKSQEPLDVDRLYVR